MEAVPEQRVGVEGSGGVEPERMPLLPVAGAVDVDVGLDQVGLSGDVAKELEV